MIMGLSEQARLQTAPLYQPLARLVQELWPPWQPNKEDRGVEQKMQSSQEYETEEMNINDKQSSLNGLPFFSGEVTYIHLACH